jgi:hypothetical protein
MKYGFVLNAAKRLSIGPRVDTPAAIEAPEIGAPNILLTI